MKRALLTALLALIPYHAYALIFDTPPIFEAPPDVFTTYEITAQCVDCLEAANQQGISLDNYPVISRLTLKNYILSDDQNLLNNNNFVSFTYFGSILLPSFSITLEGGSSHYIVGGDGDYIFDPVFLVNGDVLAGHIAADLSDFDLRLHSRGSDFRIEFSTDSWAICEGGDNFFLPCNRIDGTGFTTHNDFGNTPPQLRSVPEPHILALLSLGVAGLGFARRRKA